MAVDETDKLEAPAVASRQEPTLAVPVNSADQNEEVTEETVDKGNSTA